MDAIGYEKDVVRIFDTTLRDGEQSPGATMNMEEKFEVARQLCRLGVDVIEAGFPAASPGDRQAVRNIAFTLGRADRIGRGGRVTGPPVIAGLARANEKDIDHCWGAIREARRPRIHTFIATSPVHMEYKLKLPPEEVVRRAASAVRYARSLCSDVEFSAEDAGRSEPEFLCHILREVVKAGATTINIPDTVGYTIPEEFGALIRTVREEVVERLQTEGCPEADRVVISVHCHDDLGLATANTLAGIAAGARQAEVTVNGIGERAGNTSLEEIVMALYVRRGTWGLRTNVVTDEICRSSELVSRCSGIVVQPNKAVVGANAFAHEAGIHQDGVLKHRQTYEIMDARLVGLEKNRMVLGKHSGRHALRARLEGMGRRFEPEEFEEIFRRFKELADRKKRLGESDLRELAGGNRRLTRSESGCYDTLR